MPSLRQLQYFLTVADLGGFTPAAATLFIAQSALSRQIGMLEEELGFALFEREPRGVRLTAAGAVYRERVAGIPKILAGAAEEGLQLARGEAGVLRLLHSSTIPLPSLMPLLDHFTAGRPQVRMDLDRASSEEQVLLVANGRADMGLIRLPVLRRDARVRMVELAAERLWVALPAGHPLAGESEGGQELQEVQGGGLTLAQLRDEHFVSAVHREQGGLARVVTDLCLKRGFVPQTARMVSPKTSMLDLVAAGRGIAVIPERMTGLRSKGVRYLPLTDEDAESTCALLLPQQPSALAQAFAALLLGEVAGG